MMEYTLNQVEEILAENVRLTDQINKMKKRQAYERRKGFLAARPDLVAAKKAKDKEKRMAKKNELLRLKAMAGELPVVGD